MTTPTRHCTKTSICSRARWKFISIGRATSASIRRRKTGWARIRSPRPCSAPTISIATKTCRHLLPAKPRFTSKAPDGSGLDVDWYSAKHHVLTIGYCLDVTHKTWLEIVRQWSSHSSLNPNEITAFFDQKKADLLQARLDGQVVRLNAFMIIGDERDRAHPRHATSRTALSASIPLLGEIASLISANM